MDNWFALPFGILSVTSFTVIGLLALWAAGSPWHWLLRIAVVLAVLSPLLFIPAEELWCAAVLQVCTVAAGIAVWRWRAARRQEGNKSQDAAAPKRRFAIQFSIRTLLALACLVAMLAPIVIPLARNRSTSPAPWAAVAVGGAYAGCAVLIGAWLTTGARKRRAWAAAALFCACLAVAAAWFELWFVILLFDFSQNFVALLWFVVFSFIAVITWLLLRLWFAGRPAANGTSGRTRRIAARCLFWLLLAALALPPAYVVWQLNHRLPVPDLAIPEPNGIDDLVAAGTAFASSPILTAGAEPQSTEELAAEVAKYADDYARLRLGLTRDILAAVWAKDGKIDTAVMMYAVSADAWQAVRLAASALGREAQLSQRQKRYGDAARIALDNVRLGQAVMRDSLLVYYLTGAGVERTGNQSLYQVVPRLSADECREIIAALAEMERRREPVEDALRRDRICCENAYGWPYHLYDLLDRLAPDDHRQHLLDMQDRHRAATRLLIAELALRAYQLQHGSLPDQLDRLSPEFLAELPVDPFDPAGRPLRYVRTGDAYLVYSVGYNGRDDGGQPPPRAYEAETGGDLRLDVFFTPDDVETVSKKRNSPSAGEPQEAPLE
ncbi:MAG: hypothetical protein GXX96_07480 [Planctomycetaceae bacterium]|nr:hypothetical protein [Planctomycetaceae bacterium]